MLQWIPLTGEAQLEELIAISETTPCVIYKHSNNCGICSIIKLRLEEDWTFRKDELNSYILDVLQFRALASVVAKQFDLPHQSPQILLIRNGQCTYDADQLDVSVSELRECFEDTF